MNFAHFHFRVSAFSDPWSNILSWDFELLHFILSIFYLFSKVHFLQNVERCNRKQRWQKDMLRICKITSKILLWRIYSRCCHSHTRALTHTCTHTLILKFYIWYNYWILCVYLHCWVSSSSSSWQRWCNKMSVYKKKTKKKLKKESDNTIQNANYHFYFLKPSSSYGIRNMKVTMILLLWWLLAFLSLTIYQSFDIMLCCYVKPNRTLCVHVNI